MPISAVLFLGCKAMCFSLFPRSLLRRFYRENRSLAKDSSFATAVFRHLAVAREVHRRWVKAVGSCNRGSPF
jgi:hypothetical protein